MRNALFGLRSSCGLILLGGLLLGSNPLASAQAPVVNGDEKFATRAFVGMTAPSDQATLSSLVSARIASLAVDEGAFVEPGAVLVELDERVQQVRTAIVEAAASSTLRIDLARLRWERALGEVKQLASLHGEEFASSKELTDMRAAAKEFHLEWEAARMKQEQDQRALLREQALLSEYRIRAPFAGHVAELLKQSGEAVSPLEPLAIIVKLNPLKVVADVPIALACELKQGDVVSVKPADLPWMSRAGTIHYVQKVADSASQTVRVEFRVPNDDFRWLAGLKVYVEFSRGKVSKKVADSRSRPAGIH